jgi:hypothetical protein
LLRLWAVHGYASQLWNRVPVFGPYRSFHDGYLAILTDPRQACWIDELDCGVSASSFRYSHSVDANERMKSFLMILAIPTVESVGEDIDAS